MVYAYSTLEMLPVAGGATFQPAWAARVAPIIGSGLYALMLAALGAIGV